MPPAGRSAAKRVIINYHVCYIKKLICFCVFYMEIKAAVDFFFFRLSRYLFSVTAFHTLSAVRNVKQRLWANELAIQNHNEKRKKVGTSSPQKKNIYMWHETPFKHEKKKHTEKMLCSIQNMLWILIWVHCSREHFNVLVNLEQIKKKKKTQGCNISIAAKWLMGSPEVCMVSHFHLSDTCQIRLSHRSTTDTEHIVRYSVSACASHLSWGSIGRSMNKQGRMRLLEH